MRHYTFIEFTMTIPNQTLSGRWQSERKTVALRDVDSPTTASVYTVKRAVQV
jgi:hypothetical protein